MSIIALATLVAVSSTIALGIAPFLMGTGELAKRERRD